MPWSPDYVSPEDLAAQKAVARLLEQRGFEIDDAKDKLSRWDFLARRRSLPGRPWTYVEVKGRVNMEWDERYIQGRYKRIPIKGPFITKSKADTLVRLGPTWMIVVPNDGIARVAQLDEKVLATCDIDDKDTNRLVRRRGGPGGDEKDKGIAKYIVPCELFRILGEVTDDEVAPPQQAASICYACRKQHDKEFLCRPMTEYLWAIVKGGNRDSKSWRWARVRLGLDDRG